MKIVVGGQIDKQKVYDTIKGVIIILLRLHSLHLPVAFRMGSLH